MYANLDHFFRGVEDIPSKNSGGCLFFCYVFWLWLKDNDMPTESFAINQYDTQRMDALQHNLAWIESQNGKPTAAYHFTWNYEGGEYDADGEFDIDSMFDDVTPTELSGLVGPWGNLVDEFCMNALKFSGWNYMFNFEEATADLEDFFKFKIPTL
jgi:hypothetical protein